MVGHAFNLSTQEDEAEESWIQGYLGLHGETLSQYKAGFILNSRNIIEV